MPPKNIRLPNKVTNETITKQNNTRGGGGVVTCNTTEGGMFFTSASKLETKSDHQSRPRLTTGYSYGLGFTRKFLAEYRMKLSDAKV